MFSHSSDNMQIRFFVKMPVTTGSPKGESKLSQQKVFTWPLAGGQDGEDTCCVQTTEVGSVALLQQDTLSETQRRGGSMISAALPTARHVASLRAYLIASHES